VLTASDCLRAERAGSGIRVSVICPGSVHTNITRTATFSGRSGNELDAKRDHATRLVARRGVPVPAHKPRGGRLRGCAAAQSYQFTLVAAVVEYPRVH
jgi:NAD(P)-dependent dehydrogenase (short-subunit alcohol dehydrogenase family)